MKRRLTQAEEFDIMKLILDKFLWLGVAMMGLGLYSIFYETFKSGLSWILTGAIILVLFLILIVKEYEIIG